MATFNVTTPNQGYSGPVGAVQFHDGHAVIDGDRYPAELAYCRGAGYHVEEIDTAPPLPPGPFDPSRHNADEVLAYLGDADEADALRVLDAEVEGKNRKGITGQRDAILASKKGQ
jgi:hypothetical protein